MRRAIVFALITLIGFGSVVRSAIAGCRRSGIVIIQQVTSVKTVWRVEKGSICATLLINRWYKGDISNIVLSQHPEHGIAGTNNSIANKGFAHQPAPNFTGNDHFQITVDNHDGIADTTIKTTIDVNVAVVEKL